MKTPKLLVPALLMLAAIGIIATGPKATAQTLTKAEALTIANTEACAAVGLGKSCTDAEHLAAYCAPLVASGKACVDDRAVDNKVYASYAAMSAAVIEPERNKAQFIRLQDRTYAAVLTVMRTDPAKCAAIIAAAGKGDPAVCK